MDQEKWQSGKGQATRLRSNQRTLSAPPQAQSPNTGLLVQAQLLLEGLEPAGARSGSVGLVLVWSLAPFPDCSLVVREVG